MFEFSLTLKQVNYAKKIAPCLFFVFLLSSCKKDNALDCFKSNGKDVSEIRNTSSFNTIKIESKIDANILKGTVFNVEVIAGKHIIKNVSTKVVNGALVVDNQNTCNFVRGYKRSIVVNITVPYTKYVVNNGVGTIRFAEDFAQDTLLIRAESSGDVYINGNFNQIRTSSHGNGDIYINGSTNSIFVYANGTNFLHAQNLRIKDYAFVETYSIGDCFLNAGEVKKLEINIHKDGDIYYSGQPQELIDYSNYQRKGRAIQL